MKAAWYEKIGKADEVLYIGDMDPIECGPHDVRVRIHVSGINPSDVKTRAGARGDIAFPRIIPHSDGAGVIEMVGSQVDKARIGEKVWLYNAAWQRPFGTCAQYCTLPSEQAVSLPDHIDFDAGACLGVPAMTALYGLLCDGDIRDKVVFISGGAGAVGYYAIQFAKSLGANVITTISNDEKAGIAKKAGADSVINYKADDVIDAILDTTKGQKVDHFLDVEFGGNLYFSHKIMKPNSTIATYGSMAVPEPKIPFYELMFQGISIRPFLIYIIPNDVRRTIIKTLTQILNTNQIEHSIFDRYALKDIVKAHEYVESHDFIGNLVIDIE